MRRSGLAWALVVAGSAAVSLSHPTTAGANLAALSISSVTPTGMQSDGRYHILLSGAFESPADVRATVLCNGTPWPSVVHSASASALDISIPFHRNQPQCSFAVHRLVDGANSLPTIVLPSPSTQDQITGAIDRGVSGGRHGMEFYGTFPNWAGLGVSVTCVQGGDVNPSITPYDPQVSITGRSASQLNITFNNIANDGTKCSFTPVNSAGTMTGPTWGPSPLSAFDLYIGLGSFGFYHGNSTVAIGADAEDSLSSGQRWMARAGFDTTKVIMNPDVRTAELVGRHGYNPYHLNLDVLQNACPILPDALNPTGSGSPPFLPCLARSAPYQKLFQSPYLHTIVITAYDSASVGDYGGLGNRLNPSWYAVAGNTERVVAEYRDFGLALYETLAGSGKTIIVGNWETDSELNGCSSTAGCNVNTMIEGFKLWFAARKQGLGLARTVAQARGLTGVTIGDAIEFQDPPSAISDNPKAIDAIIPDVMPQFISYSAWGGTAGNRGGQLEQDIWDVRQRFPNNTPQLYLGEMGEPFPKEVGTSWDNFEGLNKGWVLAAHARAAQRANLPATILWTAYDDNTGTAYPPNLHFFESNGVERSIVPRLRSELSVGRQEINAGATARIGGVRVSTYVDGGVVRDYLEMYIDPVYGQPANRVFPSATALAQTVVRCSYVCSGAGTACSSPVLDQVEPLLGSWRGPSQSNIAIRHRDPYWFSGRQQERWCTIKVPGLPTFGPKAVSPTPWLQP